MVFIAAHSFHFNAAVGTMKRLGATSGGIAAAALALLLVVVIVIIIIVHKSRSKKIRVLPQTLL